MSSLADLFLLDPDVVFFNHGSFGATPRPVFESYQRWQRELERQPVHFIKRRLKPALDEARAALAAFLHTSVDNVVFVTNATLGMNIVIRSLDLGPDDEVLTTDQEYGAINNTWNYMAGKRGFRYINQHVPFPATTREDFVEALWQGVTPRTKVISISHITSPTALILPVEEVCRRAREAGILTVIDGAHAPGQIPLDLDALGADYYVGNCHKWLCAPKGSAFLCAHPDRQRDLEPLIVSHGWGRTADDPARFAEWHQFQGTRDCAAFLAVPDAIRFQEEHHWDQVRAECHALAGYAKARILEQFDLEPLQPETPAWYAQMVVIPLPGQDAGNVADNVYQRLLDEYRIEVPIFSVQEHLLMRLSIQAYNTREQLDYFVEALKAIYHNGSTAGG